MDYAQKLDNLKSTFEEFLLAEINGWTFSEPLTESMRYVLSTGGKRFRPVLFLATYEIFSGKVDECALLFASAIEVLHTYSLVHDDLPCMDDDDYRRGQPTCHKKFGEDIAVLTGDALLNMAYELVFKAIEKSDRKERAIEAGKVFAMLTGADGLIGGQIDDLAFSELKSPCFDDIEKIFRRKTCNLIIASAKCGAILSGTSDSNVSLVSDFAYSFGFAFQIADDLLDGDDGDGCTILKVCGKESAEEMLSDYTLRAQSALEKIDANVEVLIYFAKIAEKRKR